MQGDTYMIKLELSLQQTNIILESLGAQPYIKVSAVIDEIRTQAIPQAQALELAQKTETVETVSGEVYTPATA